MIVENFLKDDIKRMKILFNELKPREKKVIKYRWGIYFFKTYNLSEAGRKIGISRERVRVIEKKIKKKINNDFELMKS